MPGFTLQPKLAWPAKKLALGNLAKGVADPELRAQAHPDLRDRLQADPDLQHLLPRARLRQRRGRHRPDRQGHRQRRSSPPTASSATIDVLVVATGFFTTELPIAEHIIGRAGTHPGRHLARQRDGGLQGHHGPRLPQPLHDRRPQHRPGPLEHGLHHRVPGRLRPSTRPHDEPPAATPRSSRPAGRARRGTPTSSAGWAAPSGTPAAARAGTSTRTAATPLLWPRTTFALPPLLSDVRRTGVRRPRPARPPDPPTRQDVTA